MCRSSTPAHVAYLDVWSSTPASLSPVLLFATFADRQALLPAYSPPVPDDRRSSVSFLYLY
jgi:hypothetical protein